MNNSPYDFTFKYVIVGDSATGKSSISRQFTDNEFLPIFDTTIGVDFSSKIIVSKNKKIKIQMWDTAGQEKFQSIISSYFRKVTCVILVYDISNRNSFNNLNNWLRIIRNNSTNNPYIILVGNKNDKYNRNVTYEEGIEFANRNKLLFIETSARKNYNIYNIFSITVNKIIDDFDNNIINLNDFAISNYNTKTKLLKKKKDCCIII